VSEPADVRVVPLGDGRYQLTAGGRRQIAYAVRNGGDTWIFFDGQVHVISQARAAVRRGSGRDDEAALSAPMPATVISVQTAAGQPVRRGDVLVMLEAMKMELPIRAPRDGVVRRVACRAGEIVQPGVPLLEMD
jgi:biotin carboxyl carrier protein